MNKNDINSKFCTSCQSYKGIDGGVNRKFRTTARWICHSCITHKSNSIYRNTSGKVANAQAIIKSLYAAQIMARGQE
jgi:hypothetical protein